MSHLVKQTQGPNPSSPPGMLWEGYDHEEHHPERASAGSSSPWSLKDKKLFSPEP